MVSWECRILYADQGQIADCSTVCLCKKLADFTSYHYLVYGGRGGPGYCSSTMFRICRLSASEWHESCI